MLNIFSMNQAEFWRLFLCSGGWMRNSSWTSGSVHIQKHVQLIKSPKFGKNHDEVSVPLISWTKQTSPFLNHTLFYYNAVFPALSLNEIFIIIVNLQSLPNSILMRAGTLSLLLENVLTAIHKIKWKLWDDVHSYSPILVT